MGVHMPTLRDAARGIESGGSLPSTSLLPRAAPTGGQQRAQLQAATRNRQAPHLHVFTGAMCALTPDLSCTLQYGHEA